MSDVSRPRFLVFVEQAWIELNVTASGALEAADARVEALLADGTVEPLDSEGV